MIINIENVFLNAFSFEPELGTRLALASMELELLDSDIGPHIMPNSEKGQFCTLKIVIVTTSAKVQEKDILVAIFGHVAQNPYFEFVQEID